MKLKNKKTGQEGNFIVNKDHFECVDLEYVPEYRSLAELNEEWEDYKPAEPLIKDKKIRKAVRAWASVNGDTKVFYCRSTNQICVFDNGGYVVRSIRFKLEFREDIGLEDGYYTIAELCGEEEE